MTPRKKAKKREYWCAFLDGQPLPYYIGYTKREVSAEYRRYYFDGSKTDIRKVRIVEIRGKR